MVAITVRLLHGRHHRKHVKGAIMSKSKQYLQELVNSIQDLLDEAERVSIEERLDFSITSNNGYGVIEQVWHNSNWSNSEC